MGSINLSPERETMKYYYNFFALIIFLSSCGGDDDDDTLNRECLSRQEQFAIDAEVIDNFVAENNIENVQIDEDTGLRYVIHEEGTGQSPTLRNFVEATFEGRLIDGTIFDSGKVERNLDELIGGWQVGLPLIKEGGSMTIYVPSFLGWGCIGSPDEIPPNAVTIFDIELLEIQ